MVTKQVVDHVGRIVHMNVPPQRIISLCPSITETLLALQLPGQVVGRTRYCIHPAGLVENIELVGGTKQIDMEIIKQLKPDLIIAEKEENPKEMIEVLERLCPVYVINVENIEDAFRMITDIGTVCGNEERGHALEQQIRQAWSEGLELKRAISVAYFIWRKPYMVAGNHTFIHSVLQKLGMINTFASYEGRYPSITTEDLNNQNPECIFLSSEPFPFGPKHMEELKLILPQAQSVLVDGEMFSWYGVRMLEAITYFKKLIKELEERE